MRNWSVLLIFCASSSTLAFAQSAEISVNGGISRFNGDYATAGGGDNTPIKFTQGFRLVFRFTWNQGKLFSHEIGYGYAKSHLKYQSSPVQDISPISLHQGLYNFLINATPEGSRVRPFATGGVQFTSFYPPGASVYGGSVTKFGVNYGFGLKLKLTSIWGIRGDFRQYAMPRPDFGFANKSGWMRQTEMTGGFMFMF
jgi:outer membrane protein with beta-barrel domain